MNWFSETYISVKSDRIIFAAIFVKAFAHKSSNFISSTHTYTQQSQKFIQDFSKKKYIPTLTDV